MRSSTPDAPPGQVSASQVSAGAPAAGNARPTTLRVKLADLALRVPWRRAAPSPDPAPDPDPVSPALLAWAQALDASRLSKRTVKQAEQYLRDHARAGLAVRVVGRAVPAAGAPAAGTWAGGASDAELLMVVLRCL